MRRAAQQRSQYRPAQCGDYILSQFAWASQAEDLICQPACWPRFAHRHVCNQQPVSHETGRRGHIRACLAPLGDCRLGSAALPYQGQIALDGNLTQSLLAQISTSPLFANADLRVAPASPGKAERLLPLLTHPNATFYVNLEEASLLAKTRFTDAGAAATELLNCGAARVLVTNGGQASAMGGKHGIITATPPPVLVTRVTGAGDTFMAAHIVAENRGASPENALNSALQAAAAYVSGEIGS